MNTFTKVTDATGHNVLGIVFDTPIPWPLFDGGPVDCPKDQNLATGIQAVLDGEEEKDKERITALEGVVTDLSDEIEEECEGDLKSAEAGLVEALEKLRAIKQAISTATVKVEPPQPGAQITSQVAANHERLVRRSLALDLLLNPTIVDALGDALAEVEAARKRVADAITDLSKQKEEARGDL